MQRSSKIIFFGNERLSSGYSPHGAPTLQALIACGYQVVAVIANYERGTSRQARRLEIAEVAQKYHIPLLLPESLRAATDQLKCYNADLGVLVAYGRIVPQSIIDLFPHGILNLHPSLLPQYRGPTPIEQAILDGANKTGISLMKLVKEMDAGPIYAQTEVSLNGTETKQNLTTALLAKGGDMLISNLPSILSGQLQPIVQDEAQATYTHLLDKNQSALDLNKTAPQLERQIRAFAIWPKSRIDIFGQSIVVLAARVAASQNDGTLVLPCGKNTFLEILDLTAPSGKTMSGADFIRGYKRA